MKFNIEINIPEITEEDIEEYIEGCLKYNAYVESKTVCRFSAVKYLVDNPYNIITEITNQINTLLIKMVEGAPENPKIPFEMLDCERFKRKI
jgi:cell division ATPase FtsA